MPSSPLKLFPNANTRPEATHRKQEQAVSLQLNQTHANTKNPTEDGIALLLLPCLLFSLRKQLGLVHPVLDARDELQLLPFGL